LDLEVTAEKMMRTRAPGRLKGGYASPPRETKFPFVLCTSVNDEIVHGMPSQKKVLKSGDIISIDTGSSERLAMAIRHHRPVGEVSPEARRLMDVTRESLEMAIEKAAGQPAVRYLWDRRGHVTANGFSVVREFVGHGIGTQMHEEPQTPNYVDRRSENPRLKEGMVLAIEPMVNAGKAGSRVRSDKWTAVTEDGKYSAHFEHTVAITAEGPWVLTRP
jgi:methionyl aminopeptidase